MRLTRLAVVLTVLNFGLLVFQTAYQRPASAARPESILRGRALEIVDESGRVRASIKLEPRSRKDGKTYPEAVLLRLIDQHGRPGVKLETVEDGGAGLLLLTRSDGAYIRLDAVTQDPSIKLIGQDGREHVVKP
jgi:hypothetical protein